MGVIGDLVVRLKADDKQFTDGVRKSEDRVKKFSKFMLSAAGIAGAVLVFRKLIGVAKELITAFGVQEQAEAKLRSAIRATGRESEISAESLFRYAAELQNATIFGDEATISALALLQQLADLDEEGLKAVIPGIQDMSVALGISLETAASLVGKTLGSTTNALTRYGIVIDPTADKTTKLAEITEQLQAKFGGLSEDLAGTATGALTQYKNVMGDLQELLGGMILKSLLPLIKGLTGVVKNLTEAIGGLAFQQQESARFQAVLSGKMVVYKEEVLETINAIEDMTKAQVRSREFDIKLTLRKLRSDQELLGKTIERNMQIIALEQELSDLRRFTFIKDVKNNEILTDNQKILLQAVRDVRDGIAEVDERVKIFGDDIDEVTEKKRILIGVINDLVGQGFTAEGVEIQRLIELFGFLLEEENKQIDTIKILSQEIGLLSEQDIDHTESALNNYNARKQAAKEEADAVRKASDEIKRQRQQVANAFVSTTVGIVGALSTIWDNYYAGLLAGEELTDEERRKIQHDAAVGSKAIALFEAGITGAQAIVSGFASKPFLPVGLIMGALATALTGFQIAAIASTPIPALAEGGIVNQPTVALLGEAGPEIVAPLDSMPMRVTVNLGSNVLFDEITQGTRDRNILIDKGAIA